MKTIKLNSMKTIKLNSMTESEEEYYSKERENRSCLGGLIFLVVGSVICWSIIGWICVIVYRMF